MNCEFGTYTPFENATACMDCFKPVCASEITWCDAITGAAAFDPHNAIVAATVVCNVSDPMDPCDAPEYCRHDVPTCNTEPNRYTMQLQPMCPSLLSHTLPEGITSRDACWDQAIGGTDEKLLFSSDGESLTIVTPAVAMAASCGEQPVQPLYRYFVVQCPPGAVECSDERLDCNADVDLSVRWWERQAVVTLFESVCC